MRLVDADALVEYANNQIDKSVDANVIWRFPFVDVMPVVHGQWIDPEPEGYMSWNKGTYAQCSVCSERQYLARKMKYCPNCGAKMNGDAKEGDGE